MSKCHIVGNHMSRLNYDQVEGKRLVHGLSEVFSLLQFNERKCTETHVLKSILPNNDMAFHCISYES